MDGGRFAERCGLDSETGRQGGGKWLGYLEDCSEVVISLYLSHRFRSYFVQIKDVGRCWALKI